MFITLPIKKIIEESKNVKSFYFDFKLNSKPGQFIMLSILGIDEKPFGISYQDDNEFAVSIFKVGPFTEQIFKLKQGDYVGVKGPFGNGFELDNEKNIALIAGGYGIFPLMFFAEEITKKPNIKIHFINGARTKEKLLFVEKIKKLNINSFFCTDDGSFGEKCFTTDMLSELIKKDKVDLVCACGPEIMMKKVFEICEKNNIKCQLSLERMIKCGGGLCGSCTVDPTGWRVCQEGPVFTNEQIKQISEFGKYKRSASGKKVNL